MTIVRSPSLNGQHRPSEAMPRYRALVLHYLTEVVRQLPASREEHLVQLEVLLEEDPACFDLGESEYRTLRTVRDALRTHEARGFITITAGGRCRGTIRVRGHQINLNDSIIP